MNSVKTYMDPNGLQVYGYQALGAAQEAIHKFEAASTPWQRPPDYYAEMVKNDDHMAKVKQQLMHEQEQMEAVEQRYEQALCCYCCIKLAATSSVCARGDKQPVHHRQFSVF